MRGLILSIFTGLLCVTLIQAQTNCDAIMAEALQRTASSCQNPGRNIACYGHSLLDASLRDDSLSFDEPGDFVSLKDVDSIRHGAFNEADNTWGISILEIQANLPSTLPGQLVRMIVFGDVAIENAVQAFDPLSITANSNTRLRSSPSSETDFNIVRAVASGESMIANGRNESGEWLHVSAGFDRGWIAAIVVDGDAERMSLPLIEPGETVYDQMQAFYLTSNVRDVNCNEVPENGVVLQTPDDVDAINFNVNGVNVLVGSTVFLQTIDGNLRTYLLEGRSSVSANGLRQFLPAGTFVDVPLADNGREASGIPAFPQPYDPAIVANLPLDFSDYSRSDDAIIQTIVPSDPVPADQIETALADTYVDNPYGLVSGWYRMTPISFEQLAPNPFTNGFCASQGTALAYLHTEFSNASDWAKITRESLTSFTLVVDNSPPEIGSCIAELRGIWTAQGPN